MKTSQIICLILAAALATVSWLYVRSESGASEENDAAETAGATNEAYDCIMTRTSCRSFTDYRPSEQQIDSLLRAGMAAPTAANQQAWQFVVITDRDILDSIASTGYMSMLREAPLALVPCGDLTKADKAKDFWTQDLSAVSENILLAAHSMGLGAVWCGVYPVNDRTRKLSEILELPDSIIPLSCIPVGQPKGKLTPKDKFDEEKIHYNGY